MPAGIEFYRFSTAGNTSLFVTEKCVLKPALQAVPSEQAGIVNIAQATLEMGGNELCINASLAFAALLHLSGLSCAQLHTAGFTLPCKTTGEGPLFRAKLKIPSHPAVITAVNPGILVSWPGISHFFIECSQMPAPESGMAQAQFLLSNLNLAAEPASGVTWWRNAGTALEIMPFVHVSALDTFYLEGACGSASISLALLLGTGAYRIRQYSGEYLKVVNSGESLAIEAPVQLLAKGRLWI